MQLIKLLFKPSALITSKLGNITKFSSMAMNDCSTKLDHKINLVVPSLDELKSVLHDSMVKNYENVSIDIVECPNLRESPFRMTGSGIGNNLRIAEVGGIPNLYPHGTKKIFNLKKVCETCELPEAFVFGPGAGPFDAIGHSSELVADANLIKSQFKVTNKVSWIVSSANGYTMSTTESTDFEITANLAISDGCANRKIFIVKICATKRIGELGYAESIQRAIESYYGKNHQLVSLAGLFLLHKGDVYMHILPDYPVSPRKQDEKVVLHFIKIC
ncbi:unnamed protein product [Anisakis simplex]|uniref:DUF1907 domain-containing protein n=1 Tax=Anisakis simplex TaxID=6269 RepID=A0A0M3KEM0_ANISI|nr:unnamed protein product [Anisakis simplex]